MRALIAALLIISSSWATASPVYKCTDATGKVTFTQQACPENNASGETMTVRNPRISGPLSSDGQPDPAAEQRTDQRLEYRAAERAGDTGHMRPPTPQPAQRPRVTVVGGSRPQAECSTGLNDRDLRSAKLRGEIVPGMSRRDVESIYGNVNRNANARGAGTSTYWNDKYLSQTSVRYDTNGCAVSSWQSGHRGR